MKEKGQRAKDEGTEDGNQRKKEQEQSNRDSEKKLKYSIGLSFKNFFESLIK
jgi:hypothetical protein